MSRPIAVLVSAAALTALLAGCSLLPGGGGDGTVDETEQSPLEKIFADLYGGGGTEEEQQKLAEENNTKMEELAAQCMADEGFEYKPQSVDFGSVSTSDDWNPEKRDWVAQYGYGVVKWPGQDDQPGEEWVDPNADYLATLSDTEQQAYYAALYGEPVEGEDGEVTEYNWEDGGCYGWAGHEITGDDPFSSDEHAPLMTAIQEFWETSQNDPRFEDINDAWSSCMADAGFSGFAHQQDAQNGFYDRINAYYESHTDYVEDDPELEALGEEEIETALADLDCREETDYRAKARAVQFAVEKEFISEHQDEIDALVADAKKD